MSRFSSHAQLLRRGRIRHEPSAAASSATGGVERYSAQLSTGDTVKRRSHHPRLHVVAPTAESSLDDVDLVSAFMNGEGWAAWAIWSRHAPMVHRLLERAFGPGGEAEDVTQNVFLSVFQSIPSLRDRSALRSFIYSFALRTLKMELRRRRVRRILRLSPTGQPPELPARGADSEARQNPQPLLPTFGPARGERTHGVRVATHGGAQARRDCRKHGGVVGHGETLAQPRVRAGVRARRGGSRAFQLCSRARRRARSLQCPGMSRRRN